MYIYKRKRRIQKMEEQYVKMASQDEIAQINETINHIIKDMTFISNLIVALQNQINVLEQRLNRLSH